MKGFMYYVAYVLCFFLIRIFGKIQIKGKENIPKNQNFIIMANHTSLWDPWIIGTFIPITNPVHWFTIERLYDSTEVKQYLPKGLKKGWLGFILANMVTFTMRHTYTIKVAVQTYKKMSEKDMKKNKLINFSALREAHKVLSQQKGVVGIFAQRSRHGSIDDTSSSCLLLARKNNVPILPIHLSKGAIIIMEPEYIGKTINLSSNHRETRGILAKELMAKILNQVEVH